MALGLLLLALTFGWLVFRNTGEDKNNYAANPDPQNENREIVNPPSLPQKENANLFEENAPPKPDRENRKASNQTEKPEKPKPAPKREDNPEVLPKKEMLVKIPSKEGLATNSNKPRIKDDIDEDGVLRLPIPQNNQKFPNERKNDTRGDRKLRGKDLNEIKVVYIEITGDLVLGRQVSERIAADFEKSGVFITTTDKESADARLKIYVRHESDADTREEASVAAFVWLINEKGFVVYPNQRRVSGWKYVGTLAKLPARIAGDLIKAKGKK
jgi:hypothetical protein